MLEEPTFGRQQSFKTKLFFLLVANSEKVELFFAATKKKRKIYFNVILPYLWCTFSKEKAFGKYCNALTA